MKDELGKNFLGNAWIKKAACTVVKNLSFGVGQASFCSLALSHFSKGLELVTQPHQTLVSPSPKMGQLAWTMLSSVPDTKQIQNSSTLNF